MFNGKVCIIEEGYKIKEFTTEALQAILTTLCCNSEQDHDREGLPQYMG